VTADQQNDNTELAVIQLSETDNIYSCIL